MKRWLKLTSLVAVLPAVLFFSCQTTQKSVAKEGQITVSTDLNDVSRADIDRVKKEAEVALRNICPFFGNTCNERINIEIVEGGICRVRGGIVYLPSWRVKNKTAAVIHEVTHVIAKHGDNRFFAEGIAVFFQQKFGEDKGFPNFGKNLHELTNSYKEAQQFIPLSQIQYDNDTFRAVGTQKRKVAYVEAGSFFEFLFEKYGEQKLRTLHNSGSLNYKKVYGKNIKGLEEEWLVFISPKTGNSTKPDEPVVGPDESVTQTDVDATPLGKSYQDIIVFALETPPVLKKDYGEAILGCQGALITSLRMTKRYQAVDPGDDETSYDKESCLLVKIKLNDMRIASFGARFWGGVFVGNSYMYMHMKLVDAATQKVVREEDFNSTNNAWAATWNFGASDRSLPFDMGKIMAEYIATVVPGSNKNMKTSEGITSQKFVIKKGRNDVVRSLSPETQEVKIAKIPVEHRQADTDKRYRLAILPWSLKLRAGVGITDTKFWTSIITRALSKTIDKNQFFITQFSYYELENKSNINMINDETLGRDVINNLWKGGAISSKLNIDLASQVGSKLEVDAVLAYDVSIVRRDYDPLKAYLIDTKSKKVYEATAETYDFKAEGDTEIITITEEVFSAYEKDKK